MNSTRRAPRIATALLAITPLIALIALATPSSANAAASVTVSPTKARGGALVTFRGAGFKPRQRVRLGIGVPNSEASFSHAKRATKSGKVVFQLTLSLKAVPGPYVVLLCQNSCRTKAARRFRILPALNITQAGALAKVQALLTKNAAQCQMSVSQISAASKSVTWLVTTQVSTFGNVGTARWTVNKGTGKVIPNDQLAFEIGRGCS